MSETSSGSSTRCAKISSRISITVKAPFWTVEDMLVCMCLLELWRVALSNLRVDGCSCHLVFGHNIYRYLLLFRFQPPAWPSRVFSYPVDYDLHLRPSNVAEHVACGGRDCGDLSNTCRPYVVPFAVSPAYSDEGKPDIDYYIPCKLVIEIYYNSGLFSFPLWHECLTLTSSLLRLFATRNIMPGSVFITEYLHITSN